ncbi:NDP-hexose 2,3-dehydratase family protein [Pedobacter cryophilus]|uniref:dTDP-4-dehydro-6-deoxy-alpha-D-glucopyranose 2,3-dehydratase domain-containing protein n=1 Tax=Pedobacter cryophilus TaxID=2571271 RepID=A0A4U1C728_9SPHI|nr:NDP-hexose 2,3-dehydratase family protein [Pedobacter cryophilus]TKC00454.1 hypothetical protein FA046_01880 [Pedobacter cryophilus]
MNKIKDLQKNLKLSFPTLSINSIDFIISSLIKDDSIFSDDNFFEWLKKLNQKVTFKTEFISIKQIANWELDRNNNLHHISKKFFSIIGLSIKAQFKDKIYEWKQPIINQAEIGFLGFLCQKKNGVLFFLMQGKIEPGNVNKIQLSPTLQATKSNFTQVHGGTPPPFLDYFKNQMEGKTVLVDQLQSEQGARFLRKRNRNMIVKIEEQIEIDTPENFCWLTIKQIKMLLKYPNLVNMDTRTVLSTIQII